MTNKSNSPLSSIEDIIKDAAQGKMFILVDDENRENEGDIIIPAQMANAEAVNFMAKHARGLICLALEKKRIKQLNLPPMAHRNHSRFETAFTVSIEAKEGVTTGISAADRAKTIAVAIGPNSHANDIATPGHVFPLEAREGGVLVRAGHTEASIDIAKLAGLEPAAVICEIMNDDGSMARMPDLVKFAETHQLNIATIADLIAYRSRKETLVSKTLTSRLQSDYGGEFTLHVYTNNLNYAEHLVLVKGEIDQDKPVWVRMHALNILDDVLGDQSQSKSHHLQQSMEMIEQQGSGVIVLIREPNKTSLSQLVAARCQTNPQPSNTLRDYGIGAQILLDLGIKNMVLLSDNPKIIVGLEGYGLTIHSSHPLHP